MPTVSEISAKSGAVLDDLEQELIRQIIGVSGAADSEAYQDSRTRMLGLTAVQNKIIRVLLDQYLEDVAFDTTEVSGGSDGVDYSPVRDKSVIADEMRRIIYGTVPAINPTQLEGQIRMIPVTYNSGSTDLD